jgi:hypothetical protein
MKTRNQSQTKKISFEKRSDAMKLLLIMDSLGKSAHYTLVRNKYVVSII